MLVAYPQKSLHDQQEEGVWRDKNYNKNADVKFTGNWEGKMMAYISLTVTLASRRKRTQIMRQKSFILSF